MKDIPMKWAILAILIVVGGTMWWTYETFNDPLACTDPSYSTQCNSTTPRAVPTTVRPTAASTTSTTTVSPAPPHVQAAPEKLGTLDTYGREEMCTGFMVPVGDTDTNNGVSFSVRSTGSNGSPELVISGEGDYAYSDLRVVTGDTFNVGHVQNTAMPVPTGKLNRAYDISTPGKTLKGVLVCL